MGVIVLKKNKNKNKKTAITLLGIYQKETPSYHHKSTYSIMFMETLFIIARNWKQPRYPSAGEWIKKKCCELIYKWILAPKYRLSTLQFRDPK